MNARAVCRICKADVRQLLIGQNFVWRHLVRPADDHDAKVAKR